MPDVISALWKHIQKYHIFLLRILTDIIERKRRFIYLVSFLIMFFWGKYEHRIISYNVLMRKSTMIKLLFC